MDHKLTRRHLGALAAPLALAIAAGRGAGISLAQDGETPILAPTPACGDADDLADTDAQTEGPYFTPTLRNAPTCSIPACRAPNWCSPATSIPPIASRSRTPSRFLAMRRRRSLRQHRLYPARAPIHRRRWPLRAHHHHARYLHRPHPPHSRQGAATRPAGAHIATLFSGRAANATDGIFDPNLVMDLADADNGDGKVGFYTFVLD